MQLSQSVISIRTRSLNTDLVAQAMEPQEDHWTLSHLASACGRSPTLPGCLPWRLLHGSCKSDFTYAEPLLPASPWQHGSCCVCGSHCGCSPQLTPLDRTALPEGLSFLASPEGTAKSRHVPGALGLLGLVSPWVVALYVCIRAFSLRP